MGQVAVIGVHVDGGAKEHRVEFSKSFHNAQKFLLDRGVIALGRIEFACIVGYWTPLLFNDSAKLKITGIGFDVKRQIMIWVGKEHIRSNKSLHAVEDGLVFRGPNKSLEFQCLEQIGEGCEDVGMMRPHVMVVRNQTEEGTELRQIHRRLHGHDRVNFLQPWFDASGRKPMAQEVSLLDSPFAFEWVDTESH